MKRTHNATELDIHLVGREVMLNGWVDTRRDHGGLIFVDLGSLRHIQLVFSRSQRELHLQVVEASM